MRPAAIGFTTALCLGLAAAVSATPAQMPAPAPEEFHMDGGHLGPVVVYVPDGKPGSVVLIVSGAEGWNSTMAGMAHQLQSWGALVAGMDGRRTLPATTQAAEFARLGHELAKREGLGRSPPPLLVGYGSGGQLAHTISVAATRGTFGGVITLGTCVDPSTVPLTSVQSRASPGTPWLALHGALDRVCDAVKVRAVVNRDPAAKFVLLPRVSHDFSVEADWLPQFHDAYAKLVTATTEPGLPGGPRGNLVAGTVADLPLVEVPTQESATGAAADTFVVLLTGDGGWAGLDKEVASALARRGVPVVALSTLRYFWRDRTPAQAALDLTRIVQHYVLAWRRHQVLLVGYSFGANVLPFIVGQLPRGTRQAIRGISLLAPATHTGFEVHVADWIPGSVPEGQPVLPALEALTGTPILCVTGAGQSDNLCAGLPKGLAHTVELPGGHHFDGDSATLAREILGFTGL